MKLPSRQQLPYRLGNHHSLNLSRTANTDYFHTAHSEPLTPDYPLFSVKNAIEPLTPDYPQRMESLVSRAEKLE